MSNFNQKAYNLAAKIDPHLTSPNPRVGCVIMKDNKIIAEGVHEKFGDSHAEQNAISTLPPSSSIYITLEPCGHFEGKKTPSCTELLIKNKPKKVYIGSLDPQFNGKNVEKLRSSGIEVEILNDGFHEKLNPFFKKHISTKKPYITLKIAQSLDGKITNTKKYITNKKSLEKVHQMRANYSAILTTTQTILADNPQLNVRLDTHTFSNPKIIIVGKTKIPKSLRIFQIPDREIFQFTTFQEFWDSGLCQKIDSIMTECGSVLNSYLLKNNFVDEINLFIAPKIIGGNHLKSFNSEINLKKFSLKSTENLDGDVLLSFY